MKRRWRQPRTLQVEDNPRTRQVAQGSTTSAPREGERPAVALAEVESILGASSRSVRESEEEVEPKVDPEYWTVRLSAALERAKSHVTVQREWKHLCRVDFTREPVRRLSVRRIAKLPFVRVQRRFEATAVAEVTALCNDAVRAARDAAAAGGVPAQQFLMLIRTGLSPTAAQAFAQPDFVMARQRLFLGESGCGNAPRVEEIVPPSTEEKEEREEKEEKEED
jgi:hypothetical protein